MSGEPLPEEDCPGADVCHHGCDQHPMTPASPDTESEDGNG